MRWNPTKKLGIWTLEDEVLSFWKPRNEYIHSNKENFGEILMDFDVGASFWACEKSRLFYVLIGLLLLCTGWLLNIIVLERIAWRALEKGRGCEACVCVSSLFGKNKCCIGAVHKCIRIGMWVVEYCGWIKRVAWVNRNGNWSWDWDLGF